MDKTESPTTLRIPAKLKKRIAAVAKDEGQTAHSFMLQALEESTALAEARREFHRDAELEEAEVEARNQVYPAEAVFEYLERMARGQKVSRPKPIAWRR
jgi:hypothetical protein